MVSLFRTSSIFVFIFTILTGVVYPLVTTALSQWLFYKQANGSIMDSNGKRVGSTLIGQHFDDPKYFWGRPSATGSLPYNAAASSGSNLGPSNPALLERIAKRVEELKKHSPDKPMTTVPVDLVTASGSGLDPHISPASALFQISRIARTRVIRKEQLESLVKQCIEPRLLGVWGEPRVNVLRLNRLLDQQFALADKHGSSEYTE